MSGDELDALAMANNCAGYVARVARQMSTEDGALQAKSVGDDTRAAATARVGAALALVALAGDMRRIADTLTDLVKGSDI